MFVWEAMLYKNGDQYAGERDDIMDDITSDVSVYKFVISTFNGEGEDPQPNTVVPDLVPWSPLICQGRCHSASLVTTQSHGFSQGSTKLQISCSPARWKQVYCSAYCGNSGKFAMITLLEAAELHDMSFCIGTLFIYLLK